MSSVHSAEDAARDLRNVLGLGNGPLWELGSVAEAFGLYAFSIDLHDDSLDGSYLRLDRGGVALINGAAPSGRRRFTLVHELGHHYFADDYSAEWIVGGDGEERERLINAFAIHFLMPRETSCRRWADLDGRADPRSAAITLGAEFGLSWSALLGHLLHLELISRSQWEQLGHWRPTKADYLESGITYREELSPPYVAPRFAQAVIRAFRRHKIGRSRAIALLRGTVQEGELPDQAEVPLDSMLSQMTIE